ncbi:2'-5' RNA ligase [Dyella lipolytica]|uniref:RNA 2',3'-cyclic phosphodiesterase n=1 Tax=Dyella lipolytica TaxID=1867835 RepID=A0ABW8IUN4_9GAMM|nr:RNA 2',3'-cyclic phosphodiesterase [Dyella lipolytica]GLQ46627.1 2'-5' RNA ligase [Dyella lipolytica]
MSFRTTKPATAQIELFAQPPATQAKTHRLFFALIPDEVAQHNIHRAALLVEQQYPELRARWVNPERYHATLSFLGDYPAMPDDVVEKAKSAADHLHASSFIWTLDYAASFRGREPPCILRSTVVPDSLLALWDDLNTALTSAGVHRRIERKFTPHVTLAYGRRELPGTMPIVPITWRVERIVLIHNVVGKGRYQWLGNWRLSARVHE